MNSMLFQPLVAWCICFCLGILAGRYCNMPALYIFLFLIIFIVVTFYLLNKRICFYLVFGIAFLLGCLDIVFYCNLFDCGGSVGSRGDVRVETYEYIASENSGELLARGRLRKVTKNIGADTLNRNSVSLIKGDIVVQPKKSMFNYAHSLIVGFRHGIRRFISSSLPSPFSDILAAMLLGEKAGIPKELKLLMIRTGTWHLMVVSGTHTALVASLALLLMKILRLKRKAVIFLTIFYLGIYCILTGASSSVVRATVMMSAYLLTYLFKRPVHFLNSLALAALVILLFNPMELLEVGFQLSFLSVFFIFLLYAKIKTIFPAFIWKSLYSSIPANCFCVSLSAWLGTTPLLAHSFGTFSVISVFANMIIAPLAALVMYAGVALIGLGTLSPVLADSLALSTKFFITLFIKVHLLFGSLDWASILVPKVPLSLTFACYFLIIYISGFFPRKK